MSGARVRVMSCEIVSSAGNIAVTFLRSAARSQDVFSLESIETRALTVPLLYAATWELRWIAPVDLTTIRPTLLSF